MARAIKPFIGLPGPINAAVDLASEPDICLCVDYAGKIASVEAVTESGQHWLYLHPALTGQPIDKAMELDFAGLYVETICYGRTA